MGQTGRTWGPSVSQALCCRTTSSGSPADRSCSGSGTSIRPLDGLHSAHGCHDNHQPRVAQARRQLPDDEDIDVIDWTSGTSRIAAQELTAALIQVANRLPLQVLGTCTGRPCTPLRSIPLCFFSSLLSRDLNQSSLLVIYIILKLTESSKASFHIFLYFRYVCDSCMRSRSLWTQNTHTHTIHLNSICEQCCPQWGQ